MEQTSKQNMTRYTEIKNKLTVTRREVGGETGRIRGKYCQETCVKDTWTKAKRGRIEGGKWGWLRWGGVMGGNGDKCT